MANLTEKNGKWGLTSNIVPASSSKTLIINTQNKYLDKDIQVNVDAISLDAARTVTGNTSRHPGEGYVSLTVDKSELNLITNTPVSGTYYTLTAIGSGEVSTDTGYIVEGTTTSREDSINRYIMKSVYGSAKTGTPPNTGVKVEIQPNGYLTIPAGYYPEDRHVYANKADTSGESQSASGYSLSVISLSGESDVVAGTYNSSTKKYPITANNLSVEASFSASTSGWFSSGSAIDADTDGVTIGYMPKAVSAGNTASATISEVGSNETTKTHINLLATKPSSGTYYTLTANGSGSSKISTGGYLPTNETLAEASTTKDYYIVKGTIDLSAVGGTSSGTINRGEKIKIGAGYYPTDLYYTAQDDAHTYFQPDSDFFQTGTSGAVGTTIVIPANQYTTSNFYLKAGTAGNVSGGAITGTNVNVSDTDNGIYVTRAEVSYSITKEGWISSAGTGLASGKKYITGITVPKDKPFTLTTTADTALDTTSNITITNNAFRQLAITNNTNGDVNINGAGRTDFTSGSATTGNLYVIAYNDASTPAKTASKQVVTNGKWTKTSLSATSTSGDYYGWISYTRPDQKTDSGNTTLNDTTTTKTFAAGYYANEHGATHATVNIPDPTIAWDSTNKVIKATGSWTAGFTVDTSYSKTATVASLDSNFKAENIKSGVTIFGVQGTHAGEAHTSFTPSTTYFQTGTSGAVSTTAVIPANQYTGTAQYLKAGTASAISGGGLSGANVSFSTSNTSGISVTRAAASYSISTAGWISSAGTGLSADTQYLTGVTILKPSSGTRKFAVTVPNGTGTATFTFNVDSSGNVTVTES